MHSVAIHELTPSWFHTHMFLLPSCHDKHFTIPLSAYVLLFFLSFFAWFLSSSSFPTSLYPLSLGNVAFLFSESG